MPRHVRKGDTVMITAGDQRGKVGEVKRVITKSDRVIVQGVNLRTKHLKPTRINPQGGIITKEAPFLTCLGIVAFLFSKNLVARSRTTPAPRLRT